MTELAETIEQIAGGLEKFKSDQSETARQMKRDLERLETRMSRPGAFVGDQAATAPDNRPVFIDQKSGQEIVSVRSGDNVVDRMAAKGRTDSGDRGDLADFLRGVAGMRAKNELSVKALGAGTDTTGGYLLPSAVFGDVLQAMVAESVVMRAGAQTLLLDPEGDGAKSWTFAAIDTIPTAAWRNENANISESDPAFRAVTVVPRSIAFFFKVSRELLADASNLAPAVRLACAQAFAKEFDRVGLLGTGTAPQPRGIANTSGVLAVSNGANGASLASTKFANMFSAANLILDQDGPMPTAAIMSHRSRIGLGQLVATDGQPLQTPQMLSGVQQWSTSQLPNNITVGTSTDCSQMFVGDFMRMGYALREGVSIRAMEQTFATTGQIGFFCHARADVFVTYPKAFAVVSGIRP